MESSGLPLKIHCSEATYEALTELGGYYFEERGIIDVKGKGQQRTYWIVGQDMELIEIPDDNDDPAITEVNDELFPRPMQHKPAPVSCRPFSVRLRTLINAPTASVLSVPTTYLVS